MDTQLNKEIANSITHAIGLIVFIVINPILILYTFNNGSPENLLAAAVFCFTLIFTYLSSTLYHAIPERRSKYVLRIFDHISIYFLIGGSYTVIIQFFLWDHRGHYLLAIMWALIIAGAFLKIFFTGKYDFVSTVFYLVLGWMAVIYINPMYERMPHPVFYLIIGGGISYSLGVIFYAWKRYTYHHAVWHIFVFGGSLCHFIAATWGALDYLPTLQQKGINIH